LARFDAETRIDPAPEHGVQYEHVGRVVRAIGEWNAVVYANLTVHDADVVITDQVAFFGAAAREMDVGGAGTGEPVETGDGAGSRALEWKVYGHDLPADLGARLAGAGFHSEEPETLVVFDLADGLPEATVRAGASRPELEIGRVVDDAGLADFTGVAAAAFGRNAAWQAARMKQYSPRLTNPTVGLYVAYADGRPVASARAEFPPGRSFAGLWGGGTVPDYRGRGIYRVLVHARAAEARRRGFRYLRVDARETSRPILERLGFIALTSIVEWRLPLSGDPAIASQRPDTDR